MSKTILYVEDNEDNVQLVRAIGESAGYTIHIAYDGNAGIALAKQESPDLIIIDYHLPGMNGIQLIEKLREDDATADIPMMMLTADLYSYPEAVEMGVTDFLSKPIRRKMFLNRVERILEA